MGILSVQGEKLESNITNSVVALWPARPKVADPGNAATQWRHPQFHSPLLA